MENAERKWLVLDETPPEQKSEKFSLDAIKLINLDLVRHVDQVTPTHIRLHFSETHTVEIHGGGAGELVLNFPGHDDRRDSLPKR